MKKVLQSLFTGFFVFVQGRLGVKWILALFALIFGSYALRYASFSLEDTQIILFPLVLLVLWRLPRRKEVRIPSPLVIGLLLLWAGGALNIRGYFPSLSLGSMAKPTLYFMRLEEDESGLEVRAKQRRFNQVSKAYGLPKADLLQRKFNADRDRANWMRSKPHAIAVVDGDKRWMRVSFQEDQGRYFPSLVPLDAKAYEQQLIRSMKMTTPRDAFVMAAGKTGLKLFAAGAPEFFELPERPAELAHHLLSWISGGLAVLSQNDSEVSGLSAAEFPVPKLLLAKENFYEATKILGPWKTNAPLGLAHYLLGTSRMIEAHSDSGAQQALLETAVKNFRIAASFVHRDAAPEIYGAIFNNAALSLLSNSLEIADVRQARQWLGMATLAIDRYGQPVRAAKLAFVNIAILDSVGLY